MFPSQRKNYSASEQNTFNHSTKNTVKATNADTNEHTHPKGYFKVPDVRNLPFGVFISCRRVRVVLSIGSPGVYTGCIALERPRSSSLHSHIATLHIAIAYCCYCCYSCCSTLWLSAESICSICMHGYMHDHMTLCMTPCTRGTGAQSGPLTT